MANQVNTRSVILDILIEIIEKDQYTHIVLRNALKKYQYLSHEDRAFISRVVLGCVERKLTLDYIINSFSNTKTNKMKPVIRNILRMGTYQLVYMEGTGDFAACNEAVKLAAKRGFSQLKGFVNGVLRNISREKDNVKYPDKKDNPLGFYSVKYSMPEWIVADWMSEYSEEQTVNMLNAQFADRPLTIRCNMSAIMPDELADRLRAQGIIVRRSPLLLEAMEISGYDYLEKIEEFRDGLFFVQDISSMLVCHAAAPAPNSYVIDVCAAPGGKSMHMAEMLNKTGYVEARDVSEAKVQLIQENIDRLNLENVAAVTMDGRVTDELSVNKADVVIADVPCSGLGIINKKPDIKYHVTAENCQELVKLQREILSASAEYVKPGGTLIYSTCTVNPKENIDNALWFQENSNFRLDSLSDKLPELLRSETTDKGYIQLLPGCEGNNGVEETERYDGFFIARFVRN